MALDDINKMLEEARNQALISVAINAGANMLIGYWTSSYQKAVEQVSRAHRLLDVELPKSRRAGRGVRALFDAHVEG